VSIAAAITSGLLRYARGHFFLMSPSKNSLKYPPPHWRIAEFQNARRYGRDAGLTFRDSAAAVNRNARDIGNRDLANKRDICEWNRRRGRRRGPYRSRPTSRASCSTPVRTIDFPVATVSLSLRWFSRVRIPVKRARPGALSLG